MPVYVCLTLCCDIPFYSTMDLFSKNFAFSSDMFTCLKKGESAKMHALLKNFTQSHLAHTDTKKPNMFACV